MVDSKILKLTSTASNTYDAVGYLREKLIGISVEYC